VLAVLLLLWLAGSLRAFALWAHDPLYAYANSYDQTRYTSCFHFYPDRPAAIPPQRNSPQAPFARYRFIASEDPMCYWSSELLFTGATTLAWRIDAALTGGEVHQVRWVGALRWLALLALSIALSRAWLQRGNEAAAIGNAVLVPLLFADPGNTLYLNTFYAEWTALLAAYGLFGLALLWHGAPCNRRRFGLLALAAFALAMAKIQHLVLPLGLACVLAVLDWARPGQPRWRALALACGALAGLGVQLAQLQRSDPMMNAIDQYNRADVVFTALLPFADDPAKLLSDLGIEAECLRFRGEHAWEFPDLPEKVCPGLANFTRGTELAILLRHPALAGRLAVAGVEALDPWIARNLGEVEGGDFASIPSTVPSLGRPLHAWPWLRLGVLALPCLALVVLLVRPGMRRGGRSLDHAALTVAAMAITLGVTVLGDGLADTAKQGHLVVNAALAWLLASLAWLATRAWRNVTSR